MRRRLSRDKMTIKIKKSLPILFFLVIIISFSKTIFCFACGAGETCHIEYETRGKCGAEVVDIEESCNNQKCHTFESGAIQCNAWQTPRDLIAYGVDYSGNKTSIKSYCDYQGDGEYRKLYYHACWCDKDCLVAPTRGRYFDTPDKSSEISYDPANPKTYINLPVLLSWDSQWSNDDPAPAFRRVYEEVETCNETTVKKGLMLGDHYCSTDDYWIIEADRNTKFDPQTLYYTPERTIGYGDKINDYSYPPVAGSPNPQTYLVEFEYIPTTILQKTPSLNLTIEEKENKKPIKNGKFIPTADKKNGIYQIFVDKAEFNEVENAKPCFFESSSLIRWRVRPCCDKEGKQCLDENKAQWWEFKTSTAPEMKNPADPVKPKDPDWNGKEAAVTSFKEIVPGKNPLQWCAAKLPDENQKLGAPAQYAGSYQMAISSNEKNDFTSGLVDKISEKVSSFKNYIISLFGGGSNSNNVAGGTQTTNQQAPHILSVINGSLIYNIYPDQQNGEVETVYPSQGRSDLSFFSRNRNYTWKLKSCADNFTARCFENYGQAWKVNTIKDDPIDAPEALSPKDGETVGFPISIAWTIPLGANSFRYETTIPNFTSERKATWNTLPNRDFDEATKKVFTLDNVAMKLNTTYTWRVQSCPEFDSNSVADCDKQSKWFSFTTTGRPPAKSSMKPSLDADSNITFPQSFEWEKVPGARSYVILFDGADGKKTETVKFGPNEKGHPNVQFDYPDIQPPNDNISGKTYTWKVKTCADSDGKICGEWETQYFATKRPDKPVITNIKKTPYGSLGNLNAAWRGQTKHYWVTVTQLTGESGCKLTNPAVDKNMSANSCSTSNNCIDPNTNSSCAGTYEIKIQPCANPNCSDRGDDNAARANFIVATGNSMDNTFAVCSHNFNNPKTEWDETERCQIRHVFLLLKIAIDFLMFKLALLMLPILVLISGGIFYLGQQGPKTIPFIKNMWKWIGIGYALMIFAWLLVSWMMAIVGYSDLWWKVL